MSRKHPFTMRVKPGRYVWCSCVESKRLPFCDGSHVRTGSTPMFVEITQEQEVSWCGCKMSAKKPFCDGTHERAGS